MDSAHFDRLTRIVSIALSRRTTLAVLASGVFGADFRALLEDAQARKKHKHKRRNKRKTCKGDTKKCGKKCIPASGCCISSDCGANGACVGNTCRCTGSFKECNDACIPVDECCDACPGDTVCDNGECVCAAECCDSSECPSPTECLEGLCLCPGADAINCDEICCDGANEVCKFAKVGNDFVPSCQAGGCPATNFCADFATEQFVCANDLGRTCVCTSTADQFPGKVCIDAESLNPDVCEECETTSACGAGRVCIADGPGCNCGSNYCVDLCPEVARNSAEHGAGSTPVDLEALTRGMGKRRREKPDTSLNP